MGNKLARQLANCYRLPQTITASFFVLCAAPWHTCRVKKFLILLCVAACQNKPANTVAKPPQPASTTEGADIPAPYIATANDLAIALTGPAGVQRAGARVELTLTIHNQGKTPRRVYVLPEHFRSPFHFLWLADATGAQVATAPPSPPHGIEVTEAHFPEIAAGASLTVQGHFDLPANLPAGSYRLGWRMRNTLVHAMPGGIQTLDGVTKPLFGGGEIPGIWMGSLDAFAPIVVGS
jgi:hypothetical protein